MSFVADLSRIPGGSLQFSAALVSGFVGLACLGLAWASWNTDGLVPFLAGAAFAGLVTLLCLLSIRQALSNAGGA